MSDAHSQSTGTTNDGARSSDVRGDTPQRSGDSWIDRLRAAVGWKPTTALREDLETALKEGGEAEDGGFSVEERAMIRNILRLRETRVDDVMVPRAEIVGIDEDATLDRVMLAFLACGHSRMPVYRESLDDAIGMIHIRDLMAHVARAAARADGATLDLARADLSMRLADADLVRPVLFVPGSMPATDLLARMQSGRIQIALVIDEYGGVDGLASMEDIVETVVGDIEDEHDVAEVAGVVATAPGEWLADARATLAEAAGVIGIDLDVAGLDEEVETLGGLVVWIADRVPAAGELLHFADLPGLEIEIVEADARRLKRLKLRRRASAEAERAVEAT